MAYMAAKLAVTRQWVVDQLNYKHTKVTAITLYSRQTCKKHHNKITYTKSIVNKCN